MRYRVFLLATYSMGLRLGETLAREVGDINGSRQQVHIRRGKGHKDRRVPLPDLTYQALRALWCKHRYPQRDLAHGSRRRPGGHEGRGDAVRD
ncbi:MAG: tyrosine-type recombinase/integrase [Gammaproteobacteria bacterium]